MNATDLSYTPALELGRLYRAKTLSPVEVTEAALARIERLNPKLNAYLTVTADHARELARAAEARLVRGQPRGPLDGIPYSIKDLEPTAGIRTTYGSKFFEHNVPAEDGAVASRLRGSGGVLLGKTNTPHFGYKDMCDNLIGPPCKNPWNLARTSGASSGGAGAAVAAGLGRPGPRLRRRRLDPHPLGALRDLRPQALARPRALLAERGSLECPLAQRPDDADRPGRGDPAAGPGGPRRARPALDRRAAGRLSRRLRGRCARLARGLERRPRLRFGEPGGRGAHGARGPAVRGAGRPPGGGEDRLGHPYEFHKIIYSASVAARNYERARERPDWIEPTLMRMILDAAQWTSIDYLKAHLARTEFCEKVRKTLDRYQLLLTPQMPVAAWPADPGPFEGLPDLGGKPAHSIFDRVPFMYPFNLTGYPAANVPCGFTREKLPVGLQIVGRWHRETDVLRAAACFETLQPWASHRPPLD